MGFGDVKIRDTVQEEESGKALRSPGLQSLMEKLKRGAFRSFAPESIPKYPQPQGIRAPTEVERLWEPIRAEPEVPSMGFGAVGKLSRLLPQNPLAAILPRIFDKETRERESLRTKLATSASVKQLTNKPLTEGEKYAQTTQEEAMIGGLIPAEGGANVAKNIIKND